jgi:Protein of unknown function (DUF1403)
MTRARITVPAPPFSAWARVRTAAKTTEESGFLAGAALAALRPIACLDHPIGGLFANAWRSATPPRSRRHAGRTEDEPALLCAFHLRRVGNDPGPAGRWQICAIA